MKTLSSRGWLIACWAGDFINVKLMMVDFIKEDKQKVRATLTFSFYFEFVNVYYTWKEKLFKLVVRQ